PDQRVSREALIDIADSYFEGITQARGDITPRSVQPTVQLPDLRILQDHRRQDPADRSHGDERAVQDAPGLAGGLSLPGSARSSSSAIDSSPALGPRKLRAPVV